jgi:hypothetical protein
VPVEALGEYQTTVSKIKLECQDLEGLQDDVKVLVQPGSHFDLKSVKIKKHVPSTKHFRIYSFKNPKSKRLIKILKCDYEGCGK